jgi:hypothetical protein
MAVGASRESRSTSERRPRSAITSRFLARVRRPPEAIFISYRRADSDAFAGRIRDHLERLFPKRVFLDVENVRAGQDSFTRSVTRCRAASS